MIVRNKFWRFMNKWWTSRMVIGILVFLLVFLFVLYMVPAGTLSVYVNRHIDSKVMFIPADFGLEAIEFNTKTDDGVILHGQEFRIEKSKGIIILSPGLFNPVATSLYGHAKLFLEEGYSVIIYEPRAHGNSTGKQISHGIKEIRDLNAMIDYVRSFTTYLNLPIILMGWNTGAAASINAAAQNPYVSGVISIGSYENVRSYFYGLLKNQARMPDIFLKTGSIFLNLYLKLQFGFNVLDVSPDLNIAKLDSCPVFLIHSTGDTLIPTVDAQGLKEKSLQNTELWIRDSKHEYVTEFFINLEKDDEYSKRLCQFLSELCEDSIIAKTQ